MTTNLEKFKAAEAVLDAAARRCVIDAIGNELKSLWRIGGKGKNFELEEWAVEKIGYNEVKAADISLYFVKRPSNEQVMAIQGLSCQPIEFDRVLIYVRSENFSAAAYLNDVLNGKTWSTSKAAMESRAKELCTIYIAGEGQFCCQYCGKATDDANRVTATIIARQYPGMRKAFDYCSNRCAGHDQMAHEG
ncbi:hypothetical protein LCGC14_0355050 [marine sediment metagenome]|uniref:Uncharacterized protein n=1 Tax=marine sediment metagenome TaxID=412755 RepID=A0A0F9T9P7_9ZZZZ